MAYGSPLPPNEVTDILGLMVRGLYLYYTGDKLPDNAEFTVHRIHDVPTVFPIVKLAVDLGKFTYAPVGDSTVFNCTYGVEPGDPALSMWFLAFYSGPKSQGAIFRITTRGARSHPRDAVA